MVCLYIYVYTKLDNGNLVNLQRSWIVDNCCRQILVEVKSKIRVYELGHEGLEGIVEFLGGDSEVRRVQGRMLIDDSYDVVASSDTFDLVDIEPV